MNLDLINELNHGGWSALHYASHLGFEEIVRELLIRNADINKITKDEWTPLQLAVFQNHEKSKKYFFKFS
jgi:ankyrin repeat protein